MATAGFNYAVLHPVVSIASLDPVTGRGPRWPGRTNARTPAATLKTLGWKRWWGMNDGITMSYLDPQAAIQTSDRGILGQVSTGAHGLSMASQSKTPILEFMDWFTKQATRTVAAVGGTNEVQTLTVTGTATAAGNAVIVLNDEVYSVAIASGDTAAVAAGKIRVAANYSPTLVNWGVSGATADVIYTSTVPGPLTRTFAAYMPAGLSGTFVETTPGATPTKAGGSIKYQDPNGEYGSVQGFTLMVEGIAPAGSWADYALYTRTIIHQVSQGGTTALRYDDSGNNAPVALNLAGQAQPRKVSALELLDFTSDPENDQDPYGKATTWLAPLVA